MFSFKYNTPLIDSHSKVDLKLFYCGTQECEGGLSWGPAIKDHYKIHYIHSGKGILKTGDTTFELSAGQCFLICPDTVSFYKADEVAPWTYYWVAFDGLNSSPYLKRAGLSIENPVMKCNMDSKILECFSFMFKESQNQKSGDLNLLSSLYRFLSILIDENSSQNLTINTNKKENAYIHKAKELIEMNYSSSIKINEIADTLGLSRKYFSKLFKEAMGITPMEFLLNFRLNKACDLMNNQKLSIGEISRSVGYDDQLLFSRTFKKFKGISPSLYRNIHD